MELKKKTFEEYDIKIKFKDLAWYIKVSVIASWVIGSLWLIGLFLGE